ncbi:ABC transporter permease [Kordiimonas lacus]|uniref:Putative ABC transport system permease protein n=1 Tax=Kordiimonas lacus TaxID=637679 RepID=A0A1G6YCB4_9PROT|nr:ABC transporter permease [Kordiimonas lacus]SDD87246.1 putative ABC transport system permease protein [Kordiimonas lacus]
MEMILEMADATHTIPLTDLALALVPVASVVAILHIWSRDARETLYGFARMILQLSLIGYFLVYLFAAETPWLVIAVLAIMALVSSWISLRTTKFSRRTLYPIALCSITLGGGAVLAVITQGVLRPDPWFTPQVIIPLAGMIFAASMNSVSLAAERLAAEMRRGDSYQAARSVALKAALIPITNSLFAVGLVSLPGMMTGQILSGVSPLVAARYQIMVMCMMFAAAGLSATLFLLFIRRHTEEVVPTKAD